jgi:hypothetical protein
MFDGSARVLVRRRQPLIVLTPSNGHGEIYQSQCLVSATEAICSSAYDDVPFGFK